jgi:biopolymer transport protein ExbD
MITEINVTPLVDIMLVLLIIFMVTATYIVRETLEVKLPAAATGSPTKPASMIVTIDRKGQLSLNGSPANEAALKTFVRRHRQPAREIEAILAADRDVPHGKVVRILDLLRAAGVTKMAINVLTEDSAASP